MKKKIGISILMFLMISFLNISILNVSMLAAEKKVGIGVIAGSPTGISLKFGMFPVLGIAWNFQDPGYLHLHADYWRFNKSLSTPLDVPFHWYLGVGGKLKIWSNQNNNSSLGLAVRVPVGIQWFVLDNLELFGEIVPGLEFIPTIGLDIDGGIGIRYYM